jgi:hypothetical protein
MKTNRITLLVLLLFIASACTKITPAPSAIPTEDPNTTISSNEAPANPTLPITSSTPPTATIAPAATESSTASTEVVAYGPHNFPANVDPLTGKTVGDPSLLERRPLAVKIQLFPRGGRPPWGVASADLVYDYYQNFGLTRLHAIFLSHNAETVGPIRSARLLDTSLVSMYQSIFAFGSAEQRTYSRLFGADYAKRLVVEGNTNCPPLCRVDPNGSNYLVTNTDQLSAYASSKGVDNVRQSLDGMYFNSGTPAGGQPVKQIFVRFSISAYSFWDFNPDTGRYLRYQDTQEANDAQTENYAPLPDRLTGEQLAADNVVVVYVPHQYAFNTKPGPSEVVDIVLSGSGPAYAFRDGQVFQVTWNRPNKNSVLFLTLSDGNPYALKPGNTWFEVIGQSSKLETPSPDIFRFLHYIP